MIKMFEPKNDLTLLLTACIAPKQFANKVQRNNPSIRLQDYKQALKKWLHHPDPRITHIVFAENSGHDLAELETIVKDENSFKRHFTIYQTKATQVPEGLHYGYSELELIDEIIAKNLITTNTFIKATGRIYFPNISLLLNKCLANYLFIADARKVNLFGYKRNYLLSNLFVSNVTFYKTWIFEKRLTMKVHSLSHFEQLLQFVANNLPEAEKNKCLLRFPINVDPVGFGAHWNSNYQSPKKKMAALLRAISRKILPHWYV